MWLLQVSAMPLAAAGTTEQAAENAEQGPDYVGSRGPTNRSAHEKEHPARHVLIGVGVVAVAAVLFLVVLQDHVRHYRKLDVHFYRSYQ